MKTGFCFILILAMLCIAKVIAASDLKVLVTIKPFHSLVSGIMQGVSEPRLLIEGNNSPHSYALRPSSAENLQWADLVFWGGEMLEGFLTKSIQSLASRAKLVSLQETKGLKLWPLRSGKGWQAHEETNSIEDHSAEDELRSSFGTDPHVWLDPQNAKIISRKIAQVLTEIEKNMVYVLNS